ncbi:MAG: GAF domain-containing protein [Acidobacteria bacterium]|nr:GAF domain-containing protein [Acidobacteriota bacterium]
MTERKLLPDVAKPAPLESHVASEGVMVLDPEGFRVLSLNSQMLKLLQASEKQVLGRSWQELGQQRLTLGCSDIFNVLTADCLLEGELKTISLPRGEAESTFLELASYPISGPEGKIREVVLVARDVSQRKRFESDLARRMYERDVANEFSKALQRTVDLNEVLYVTLVGVTGQQGLQFNRAFLFLFSPETNMLEGKVAIGPSDFHEAGLIWGELSQKAWTLSDLLSAYDSNRPLSDSKISAQIRGVQVPVGEPASILMRAMTERRSFNVVEDVADDGSIVDPALLETLGCGTFAVIPLYTRQKSIGVLVVDNWINRNPISANRIKLLEIFAGHASSAIENSQLYQDLQGKVKALQVSRAALEENHERLLRAERLSTVGRMAAMVAHEIRNPLVSIGGFARLLKQQIPEADPMREDVEIIISEAERLEKIVANILQYSYAQQVLSQPTDIHHVISKTLDMLRLEIQERKVNVDTALDPDLPLIKADPAQFIQVFYNLIINAIQAIDHGGTITVATERVGNSILIRVKDTGCGIPEESLDRIFTPFFTTKPSGAGLGLTVVTEIIEAHGGSISVLSEEGKGTEFFIRLPSS